MRSHAAVTECFKGRLSHLQRQSDLQGGIGSKKCLRAVKNNPADEKFVGGLIESSVTKSFREKF
jgi:hypothetical protein